MAPKRRALVAGNWKLHKDHREAIHLVRDLGLRLQHVNLANVEVAVHPPFTDLRSVQTVVEGDHLPISLGAQHCSAHERGAFTGEISAAMLAKLETRYVLVGHSERRALYAMDDATVHATARAVIAEGMVAVVCVGESVEVRADGRTDETLEAQVDAAIRGLEHLDDALVLAYEPIWAIGTGQAATPADAQAACATIRSVVGSIAGNSVANSVRVLYGGSVNAANSAELVAAPDVDGLLVGGASLEASSFADIVGAVVECYG